MAEMIKYDSSYWEDVDRVLQCVPNLQKIHGISILITGGTGMICSSLVELLFHLNEKYSANIQIILAGRSLERTCKRFYRWVNKTDFTFVQYDATEKQELSISVDYIVHGASNASPAVYVKEPVETILANIVGLQSLLSMAVKMKSERVLYISSSEVYGNKAENRPYQETDYGYVDILNPRASYPCAKRTAETLCIAYGEEYGLDTVIVRPGHIYGPSITDSDCRASAQFTRNAVRGEDIAMKSAGLQLRSYCYTLDCASAILTVLLNGEKGNTYNISNKNSVVTIGDMAKALAKAVGRQVVYENASETEIKGYNLMSNSSLDAEKLEVLGWRAEFGLQEGAEKTVGYFEGGPLPL